MKPAGRIMLRLGEENRSMISDACGSEVEKQNSPALPRSRSNCPAGQTDNSKELRRGERYSPPCINARRGGCVIKKNFAKPPNPTQPGWFSFCSHQDTTPSSRTADASRYFLDRSATPPRSYARRGITLTRSSPLRVHFRFSIANP